jgi:hypothetical protein
MTVKRILSSTSAEPSPDMDAICTIIACSERTKLQKGLDNRDDIDVIKFTCSWGYDSFSRPPAKAPDASSPRDPQPSAGDRHRSPVSRQRVLRSPRSVAGQIRDAASGPGREKFCQRFCTCLWVLSSVVLPGPIRVSAGGSLRPLSPQTRPPKRTQTHRRSDGLHRPAALRRPFAQSGTTGPSRSEAIPAACASPQHRSTFAAGKKTALKSRITNNHEALRSAYEDLRTQVFAGGRGPGLVLFIRHGMREWLEVCGSATVVTVTIEPAERARNPQVVPPEMRSEIVLILAGLFLRKRGEANR